MLIPIQFPKRLVPLSLLTAISIAAIPLQSMADAEVLSDADRVALLEKLEEIEKRSDDRVGGLYRRAIRDYRSAIGSDTATMELYLKCYEKVRFEDEKKKSQEFRDWKRKNKERLSSPSMRMALRHQLSWLLLSIEAAQLDGDVSELGGRAIKHLNQIFDNAEKLSEHRQILSQNALGSVFARAYKLNIKIENWPSSALDIAQVYDKVVMPPLRTNRNFSSLRSAWKQRITHEGLVYEKWKGQNGKSKERKTIGKKSSMRSSEFEKFLSDVRPNLLWDMEKDCFDCGDERASALRMLKHLESNITHKDAPQWIEEFGELINPTPEVVEDGVAAE